MKAVTIGSAMLDSIAIVDSEHIERVTLRNADSSFLMLEEGRKTEALEISTHCGGGAVNTAVSMARLGCEVSTLVKLGVDSRAGQILARLAAEGVSAEWVIQVPDAPSGASVLIASHERNAAIFTYRGTNTLLKVEDLQDGMFEADLVYISGLSNESADCFPELVARAKAKGALLATNPGIRQLSARADTFHDCLPAIDILSMNKVEADTLVPRLVARFGERGPALALEPGEEPPALVARGLSGGGFEMSLAGFVAALLEIGLKHVVITAGAGGAFIGSADGIRFCPVLPAEIQGTAGAGDAFGSTFASQIALGKPVGQALLAAAINAASVVEFIDTQMGLLTDAALQKRIAEVQHKVAIRHWPL